MDVLKRYSLVFLLSLLSCFFCLDSLIFWHGLASLNLVISTQHHYSAQIDFDIHEFKLFFFSRYALRYHHVFGIKWKKRKCPWKWSKLYNLITTWQWRYLTDKTGFFLLGHTVYKHWKYRHKQNKEHVAIKIFFWSEDNFWTLKPMDSFDMWWKSNEMIFLHWIIIL